MQSYLFKETKTKNKGLLDMTNENTQATVVDENGLMLWSHEIEQLKETRYVSIGSTKKNPDLMVPNG